MVGPLKGAVEERKPWDDDVESGWKTLSDSCLWLGDGV